MILIQAMCYYTCITRCKKLFYLGLELAVKIMTSGLYTKYYINFATISIKFYSHHRSKICKNRLLVKRESCLISKVHGNKVINCVCTNLWSSFTTRLLGIVANDVILVWTYVRIWKIWSITLEHLHFCPHGFMWSFQLMYLSMSKSELNSLYVKFLLKFIKVVQDCLNQFEYSS